MLPLQMLLFKRQTWFIACKRKSIWISWVYAKHIRNRSFWDIIVLSQCSCRWRGILYVRSKVLPKIQHLIGNGEKTKFQFDPWLPCGRLIDRFGCRAIYDMGRGSQVTVSSFLYNGRWAFPSSNVHSSYGHCPNDLHS